MFLQAKTILLPNCVPAHITWRMWLQHDEVPAHYSMYVCDMLDIMYLKRWIGRCGPINWSTHSPDLSCLAFFFWGNMKSLVSNDGPIDSFEDLVAWVSVDAVRIREMPGVFANVWWSHHQRCEACIIVSGCNFEQLLWQGVHMLVTFSLLNKMFFFIFVYISSINVYFISAHFY